MDQFEKIKDDFKRLCGITYKYEVRNAEDMEMALNEAIFHENALQAGSVDKFNETLYREFIKKKLKPFVANEEQLNQLVDSAIYQMTKH